jgi:hypothetical protein
MGSKGMENKDLENYIVKQGEEVTPVIVLTGTSDEFMDFCDQTGRTTKTALAIRQGFQIPFYEDLEIVLWGTYWLNTAYNSPEYNDRIFKTNMKDIK